MNTVVVNAQADTEPDGSLVVTWTLEGDPSAVDIAVGPTPELVDHRHEVTVTAGQTSCRLRPSPRGRLFVSVAPRGSGPAVVTCDRRIAFRGISNFRDLGGYRSGLDGTVRWGMVFRADALHGLSTDDLELYDALGLRRVYDLRGDEERAEQPNRMASQHLKVISRPEGSEPVSVIPLESLANGEQILADLYKGLLDHAAVQIGRLLTGLADDDGLPAVFHCHAGKDRTGVLAAVLLEALGVDREDVLDDYELTARYRLRSQQDSTFERLVAAGLSPEAAAGVLTTPRWAMEEALHHLDDQHGGVVEYLTGPAGVRKEALEALRELLIDQSGPG